MIPPLALPATVADGVPLAAGGAPRRPPSPTVRGADRRATVAHADDSELAHVPDRVARLCGGRVRAGGRGPPRRDLRRERRSGGGRRLELVPSGGSGRLRA